MLIVKALSIIDFVNRFLWWVKRNHIIRPKVAPVKVNIGCGLSVAPGWINVDASLNVLFSKWPQFLLRILYLPYRIISGTNLPQKEYCEILKNHTFVHHNVAVGMPFFDNSVDYVYSSHMFEHLSKEDAKKVLREIYRVLKKGGIVRICVPDFESIISLYYRGCKEQAVDCIFPSSRFDYLGRHRYAYDFDLLRQFLQEAGFVNIERCSYRQGTSPDIDLLDNRPAGLFVEASK